MSMNDVPSAPTPSYAATVAHRIATIALILSVLYALSGAASLVIGRGGDVEFRAVSLGGELRVPGAAEVEGTDTTFRVTDPTAREQRLAGADQLLLGLLLVALAVLLRRVIRTARDGDPFVDANVRRLRLAGGLLLVGSVAVHLGRDALEDAIARTYVRAEHASASGPTLFEAISLPLGPELLYGLATVVLAQVFAEGARLRADAEATV